MSTVISIENLWKEYRLGVIGHGTLASDLQSWWAKLRDKEDPNAKINSNLCHQQIEGDRFWALRNINIEVKDGEVLGIIGKNGAGKSTLLKILSRVTAPSRGTAKIKGRIASLLEVGTGFHRELTGRENVFLNGSILGMSRDEVKRKFDQIIDFSGVEEFIDTPVKRYSSGMYVRLAFAVAAHLEPEILVIDEVLAVGDAEFQKKCLARMGQVSQEGRTIIFVSHNMAAINRICESSVVLQDGEIVFSGRSGDGVRFYLENSEGTDAVEYNGLASVTYKSDKNKAIQIDELSLHNSDGNIDKVFDFNELITLKIVFSLREQRRDYYLVFLVKDIYENIIYVSADNDLGDSQLSGAEPGKYNYTISLPRGILKPGSYYITVSITQTNKVRGPFDRKDSALSFSVMDNETHRGANNGYRKTAIIAPEIEWIMHKQ